MYILAKDSYQALAINTDVFMFYPIHKNTETKYRKLANLTVKR
jgi:hypothetical protein